MATTKVKPLTERLRRLIDGAGGRTAFAKWVWPHESADANKAKVSKWYKGDGISEREAAKVAKASGQRLLYILYGELPEREGVTRTEAELAADLAAHVADVAIKKAGPMLEPRLHAKLPGLAEKLKSKIRGERLLALLVDMAAEEMRANVAAFRHRLLAMEDLAQIRDALSAPNPDRERAFAIAVRLLASPPPLPSGKIIEWEPVSFTSGAGSSAPVRKSRRKNKPTKRRKS